MDLTENTNYNNVDYTSIVGVTDGVVGDWAHSDTASSFTLSSDNDSAVNEYPGTDNQIPSFNLYIGSYPASIERLIDIGNGMALIQLGTTGIITFTIDRDSATNVSVNSASTLSTGTFYRVRCEYEQNSHFNIWINGVLSTTGTVYAEDITPYDIPAVQLQMIPTVYMQNIVVGAATDSGGTIALQDYKMLKENENCYTIGSTENFTDITPTYSGMTIYSKTLSATEWTQEQLTNAIPLQIDSNTPLDSGFSISTFNPALVPTFITYDGSGTLGKKFALLFVNGEQAEANTASRYIMIINNEDLTLPIAGVQLSDDAILGGFSNAGVIPNAGTINRKCILHSLRQVRHFTRMMEAI